MGKSSKKRLNSLVHRMSRRVKGLQLAHAFKLLKSNGIKLRMVELDDTTYPIDRTERDVNRINVQVKNGHVIRCWIG